MITKTSEEREEIKEILLKIVFQALISEDCHIERSIIVSSYRELDSILCNADRCTCCINEEAV